MKKFNTILVAYLLFNFIFIFISFEQSLLLQITLCVVLLFAIILDIKLSNELLNNKIYNLTYRSQAFSTICFFISVILILPYEIKIRTISFNYTDCSPMIFSYLTAATALSPITINIYQKIIRKK